jgi:hypothetical protein
VSAVLTVAAVSATCTAAAQLQSAPACAAPGAAVRPDTTLYRFTMLHPPDLGRLPSDELPDCRIGIAPLPDYGALALTAGARPPAMRRSLDRLLPNPRAKHHRIRWPLVDSFGRKLAYISFEVDHWAVRDLEHRVIYRDYTLDPDEFTVQGRGCMVTNALEARYALIAFNANDRSTLPPGASIVPYQIRAFIDRRALPARNSAHRRIRALIDRYRTGCGRAAPGHARPTALPDPDFHAVADRYYGADGRLRSLATYNTKHLYEDARYFLLSSTSVAGGGVVRGVIQQRDPVVPVDSVGYCDANATAGATPITWIKARIGSARMWGWLPRRCAL